MNNAPIAQPTPGPIVAGAPEFLTLPVVLVIAGVLLAIIILWIGARAVGRRKAAEEEIEYSGEGVHVAPPEPPVARPEPLVPPTAPSAPPIADAEVPATSPAIAPAPTAPEPAPEIAAAPEAAPESAPVPEPVAPAADDLTRMKGVGPRLADKLNSLGYTRFEQLAALTPDEAAALDARLGDFQGRLERDRWIEQASLLAKDDIAGYEATFGKL